MEKDFAEDKVKVIDFRWRSPRVRNDNKRDYKLRGDECLHTHLCPSGLRGSTQVRIYSYAGVRIP